MLTDQITIAHQTEGIVKLMPGDDNGVVNVLEPHPSLPILATSGLDDEVKFQQCCLLNSFFQLLPGETVDAQPEHRGARSLLAEGAEGIHAEDCSEVNFNLIKNRAFVEVYIYDGGKDSIFL